MRGKREGSYTGGSNIVIKWDKNDGLIDEEWNGIVSTMTFVIERRREEE